MAGYLPLLQWLHSGEAMLGAVVLLTGRYSSSVFSRCQAISPSLTSPHAAARRSAFLAACRCSHRQDAVLSFSCSWAVSRRLPVRAAAIRSNPAEGTAAASARLSGAGLVAITRPRQEAGRQTGFPEARQSAVLTARCCFRTYRPIVYRCGSLLSQPAL